MKNNSWTGDVAQVIEHLFCKGEAPSLKPTQFHKKKKKKNSNIWKYPG
jgi:hypothetical protein